MATSTYFRNYDASNEQLLLEDLIIEAIRQVGEDMYYLPRSAGKYNKLYGEDAQSVFEISCPVEIYIKSVDGFQGDGNFMSKFGLEIRDQAVFSIARRVFNQEVSIHTLQARPNEGDLIFFPLNNKCYVIRYVKNQEFFYQLGALQTWELTVELFEYSNEIMNTGIAEIDKLYTELSTDAMNFRILTEDGDSWTTEEGEYITKEMSLAVQANADNEEIQDGGANFPDGSDDFIDFSEINPFAERNY